MGFQGCGPVHCCCSITNSVLRHVSTVPAMIYAIIPQADRFCKQAADRFLDVFHSSPLKSNPWFFGLACSSTGHADFSFPLFQAKLWSVPNWHVYCFANLGVCKTGH